MVECKYIFAHDRGSVFSQCQVSGAEKLFMHEKLYLLVIC